MLQAVRPSSLVMCYDTDFENVWRLVEAKSTNPHEESSSDKEN